MQAQSSNRINIFVFYSYGSEIVPFETNCVSSKKLVNFVPCKLPISL
jgi:hypothetical protein